MTYEQYLAEISRSLDSPSELHRLTIIRDAHIKLIDTIKRAPWFKRDRKMLRETEECLIKTELMLVELLAGLQSKKQH
jgi:hypothetical protein